VAVDTFFILSGFVLAHSYARRVEAGMGFIEFARVRLLRLYPLYVVGLLLGAGDVALEIHLGRVAMGWDDWALATVLGALLVPHGVAAVIPFGNDGIVGAVFPFNEPAWSLFFELAVNGVFFAWLASRRAWMLIPIILASLGGFALAAHLLGGLHGGWGVHDFWVGVPRVMFGFFLGVGLYRIHRWASPPMKRVGPLLVLLLLVSFWRPFRWQEAWSLFVFAPLAVLGNASVALGARARQACHWAGRVSYPLYITHFPLFRLMWVEGDIRQLGSTAHLLVAMTVAVAIAWVLAAADEHVRERWLMPWLAPRKRRHEQEHEPLAVPSR
jgi:peptidoglycan/LPS O-acetylase OafA/YrhL